MHAQQARRARPPSRAHREPGECAAGDPPSAGTCTCSKVRGLARRLTAIYDAALAPHGMTVTQYAALAVLARAGAPLAVAELARRLQMDRTTTSRLVRPLQDNALVVRIDRPGLATDARAHPLRLTPRGRRRWRAAVPAWHAAQRRVERLLGTGLQAELHRVANAAGRALHEPTRRAPVAARADARGNR